MRSRRAHSDSPKRAASQGAGVAASWMASRSDDRRGRGEIRVPELTRRVLHQFPFFLYLDDAFSHSSIVAAALYRQLRKAAFGLGFSGEI